MRRKNSGDDTVIKHRALITERTPGALLQYLNSLARGGLLQPRILIDITREYPKLVNFESRDFRECLKLVESVNTITPQVLIAVLETAFKNLLGKEHEQDQVPDGWSIYRLSNNGQWYYEPNDPSVWETEEVYSRGYPTHQTALDALLHTELPEGEIGSLFFYDQFQLHSSRGLFAGAVLFMEINTESIVYTLFRSWAEGGWKEMLWAYKALNDLCEAAGFEPQEYSKDLWYFYKKPWKGDLRIKIQGEIEGRVRQSHLSGYFRGLEVQSILDRLISQRDDLRGPDSGFSDLSPVEIYTGRKWVEAAVISRCFNEEITVANDVRPHKMIGSGFLFWTESDEGPKFALGLRSQVVGNPGTWGVIGGRYEDPYGPDNTVVVSELELVLNAIRELREETKVVPVEAVTLHDQVYKEKSVRHFSRAITQKVHSGEIKAVTLSDPSHYFVTYVVELSPAAMDGWLRRLELNEEHDSLEVFPLGELPEKLHPIAKHLFSQI